VVGSGEDAAHVLRMTTSPASEALHYLFIDLELTGLETKHDDIVEFGVIGTTKNLTALFKQTIVVRPTLHGLTRIYNKPEVDHMFRDNGLLAELEIGREMDTLLTVNEAEQEILAAMSKFPTREDGKVILAGSGVWHCDLRFLQRHTPRLAARFDDREILDVGIERRRYEAATGRSLSKVNEHKNHRADVDIQCHLDEARAFNAMYKSHSLGLAA
jgi:oligoribonuclease